MPELRAAVELDPMIPAIHAVAARTLIASWSILGEEEGAQSRSIIEDAIEPNPNDAELQKDWLARREP